MNVYTDESGDLGWTLDKPYREGGSSRFFTIAHLLVPKTSKHIPKRVMKNMYSFMRWHPEKELKAKHLKPPHREHFAKLAVSMLTSREEIRIVTMTVKKENVQERLRRDSNKLYNYMIRLALLDLIKDYPTVSFLTDKRSIKVASGNSMCDYLQTVLATELESDAILQDLPMDSKDSLNIQFADFIANLVWRSHETGDRTPLQHLTKFILQKTLFFGA